MFILQTHMPWVPFSGMSEDDLKAFLQLPAGIETGERTE